MTTQGDYGAVGYRTASSGALGVKAAAKLLFDSKKRMMLMRWANQEDLPKNSGQTKATSISARRPATMG